MPDAELERLRVGLPESDGDELLGGELDGDAVAVAAALPVGETDAVDVALAVTLAD